MRLKEVERMKDDVSSLGGHVEVKIFPPNDRDYYVLTYCEEEREASYAKATACAGDARETFERTWLSMVYDVLNERGVAARMQWNTDREKGAEWFDTGEDKRAMEKLSAAIRRLALENTRTRSRPRIVEKTGVRE